MYRSAESMQADKRKHDRWLLIRGKPGDLSPALQSLIVSLRPADVVQVIGFQNALWRLGHERFDVVLLDLDMADQAAIGYCRQEIARVAAVAVFDLRDEHDVAAVRASRAQESERCAQGSPASRARSMRLPWQRRPRRPAGVQPRGYTPAD